MRPRALADFHYGYHVYAAAVAAHLAPKSVAWSGAQSDSSGAQHQRERLLLLARDIASPAADGSFPRARHKDWFLFVSWASGIALAGGAPYRNGRNQESSSEAIHAYYGVALLGTALGEVELASFGRALLAMEVVAAKTYYHAARRPDIYPPAMVSNGMVGMLWQNLAQYQTWFGPAAYLVHGIQVLPVTDVTEFVLDRTLTASGELEVFSSSCAATPECKSDGWAAFAAMERALVDPLAAWREVCALGDSVFSSASPAGNGNSRLNALYWIATRPDAIGAAVGKSGCDGSGPMGSPASAGSALFALGRVADLAATGSAQHGLTGSYLAAAIAVLEAVVVLLVIGATYTWVELRSLLPTRAERGVQLQMVARQEWKPVAGAADDSRDYARF